jgi:hypothetical protein
MIQDVIGHPITLADSFAEWSGPVVYTEPLAGGEELFDRFWKRGTLQPVDGHLVLMPEATREPMFARMRKSAPWMFVGHVTKDGLCTADPECPPDWKALERFHFDSARGTGGKYVPPEVSQRSSQAHARRAAFCRTMAEAVR